MQTHQSQNEFALPNPQPNRCFGPGRQVLGLSVLITVSFLSHGSATGQSFLEKLEATVREQLNQPNSKQGSTDELPAPKSTEVPGAAEAAQTSLPSILERDSATARSGTSVLPPSQPVLQGPSSFQATGIADAATGTGQIYLGLEAEEPVGGGIGVRVSMVTEKSPAWKSGFKIGDRILAVNGFAIANLESMVGQLRKTSPGQTVRFLISREGKNTELTSVLMDAELANRIAGRSVANESSGAGWLGASVNDLTASFRQQFGITVFRGAAVTQVANASPAAQAGIRPGDTIIEADAAPIEGAADLMRWMALKRPGQSVELLVYRGSSPRSVQLVLEVNPAERPIRSQNRSPLPPATRDPGSETLGLEPSVAAPIPVTPGPQDSLPSESQKSTDALVIQQLAAENLKLKAKLADAEQRLLETQRRLNEIVNGLKAGGN